MRDLDFLTRDEVKILKILPGQRELDTKFQYSNLAQGFSWIITSARYWNKSCRRGICNGVDAWISP